VLDHPNVIIISKAGAKTVFGDENPIGKTLLITTTKRLSWCCRKISYSKRGK
jgi:hypothetical protein